jgi:hypothetical protein
MSTVAHWDDHGVRFDYPAGWELDANADIPRVSITLQASQEPAFALLTFDTEAPDPRELVDEALAAMTAEYPSLDMKPVEEPIDGHPAVGYDLEFLSLDMTSFCLIRGFRTPRRTVLLFAQWSELDGDTIATQFRELVSSLQETDA